MTEDSSRFAAAIAAFDRANADDPDRVVVDGAARPKAVVYAERMSRRLEGLAPDASEALRLAARAQHIRRWEIARESYPRGRAGYLQWRGRLARFHARVAGEIMAAAGYDAATVARVQAMLRKEGLKRDSEVQTLEDAACLVFLEHELPDFARKHARDKVVDIVAKTWRKMSPAGREAALALDLAPEARALVEAAVGR